MLGPRATCAVVFRTFLCVAAAASQTTAPPVASARGVPNFHEVNPGLFRGGQPSAEGLRSLAKIGVKTILDLRMSRRVSDWERRAVEALGMRYIHLPLYGKQTPDHNDVIKAFSVLNDPAQSPVFVHCREGKDRTGMIVGCYRIAHDGWTNRRALAEAKSYASRELTRAMEDYIMHFQPADFPHSNPAN